MIYRAQSLLKLDHVQICLKMYKHVQDPEPAKPSYVHVDRFRKELGGFWNGFCGLYVESLDVCSYFTALGSRTYAVRHNYEGVTQ